MPADPVGPSLPDADDRDRAARHRSDRRRAQRRARRAARRTHGRLIVAAAVAVGLAVSVGVAVSRGGHADAVIPRSAHGTIGGPRAEALRPRLGSGNPVTLAFGGDVHFEGSIRQELDASPASVLGAMAPVLSRADIAMVNLETAVTEGGVAAAKQYVFRAPATAFEALRAGGVDVV